LPGNAIFQAETKEPHQLGSSVQGWKPANGAVFCVFLSLCETSVLPGAPTVVDQIMTTRPDCAAAIRVGNAAAANKNGRNLLAAIVPGSFWWRSSATSNARLPELLKRPCRAAPRNASRCTGKREPGSDKLKFYKVL
jgi:hypothetical protein